MEPTRIGLEACGAAHYWARELGALGHEVVLLPPQYVKPYVKRGKNDAADAEAICEAMSRPSMRFVPVKTAEQQAALMLAGTRDQLIRRRTQLSNTIRGYAAEFGLTAAKGLDKIEPLLARMATDADCQAGEGAVRRLWPGLRPASGADRKIEAKLMAWHKNNELSRRLVEVPAIGPIGAWLLAMKVTDPHAFRCGRDFSAWIGLTPKDHSTAGKTRLGVITRAGDEALRSVLVAGATAVIQQGGRDEDKARPGWSSSQAQATQARRRGAGQQDGAHRLEADGQRRTLQSRAQGRRHRPRPRGARRGAGWGLAPRPSLASRPSLREVVAMTEA